MDTWGGHRRSTLGEAAEEFERREPRGEIVVVVEGCPAGVAGGALRLRAGAALPPGLAAAAAAAAAAAPAPAAPAVPGGPGAGPAGGGSGGGADSAADAAAAAAGREAQLRAFLAECLRGGMSARSAAEAASQVRCG
jgi:hypothetical protein